MNKKRKFKQINYTMIEKNKKIYLKYYFSKYDLAYLYGIDNEFNLIYIK